jgi:hypothetical protein
MPFAACRIAGQAILPCSHLSEAGEKVRERHFEPPMNADER